MPLYFTTKEWNREDAIKAIEFEKEMITDRGGPMLILKFPDPKLSRDIIKNYANEIENVHFHKPSTPRLVGKFKIYFKIFYTNNTKYFLNLICFEINKL